jgi:hypothetical protein
MDLIKKVDSYLESPNAISPPRYYRGYHPSGASCIITNEYGEEEVVGKCLRSAFWGHRAVEQTNPMTARGRRITTAGKKIEEFEVENYKKMGIWRGNNVKFFNPSTLLSGEVDAFVWDSYIKSVVGVEIKTGYGNQFQKKVIGNQNKKGSPKLDHLMQVMLYLDFFKDIPYFKMVYIYRGNAARVEFKVELDMSTGGSLIDGKPGPDRLTIPAIFHRFEELGKHLEDDTLPERDYQLQYSDEKIQFLYDSKRLNKTECKAFEKSQKVEKGDWRCSYCEYKDYCWKENNNG